MTTTENTITFYLPFGSSKIDALSAFATVAELDGPSLQLLIAEEESGRRHAIKILTDKPSDDSSIAKILDELLTLHPYSSIATNDTARQVWLEKNDF